MSANHVTITGIEELIELEGDWTTDDFLALLGKLDMSGGAELTSAEAQEMCLLALSDLKPEEAAALLLTYKLSDALTEGQIRSYSSECLFEPLWKQSSEMELHRRLFAVASLLVKINDQQFQTPDALRVTLQVDCSAGEATDFETPIAPAFLLRMLATGMGDDAILKRLFQEQLEAGTFPEASSIVWDVNSTRNEAGVELTVTSSGYWLDGLRETEGFDWTTPVAA